MIPAIGQRFGPYEILGRLGGGGMGLVFRAWDERLHREVAVKLLHDDYIMPGMRERFLQEARAASGLNHPNICTVFDIGEQDGNPYLVMELLEGETLKDRIVRGALPVEEIVRYGEEIAEALAAAHARGIVHRDIKPANIFLVTMPNGRCQAKVLDFGLAKIGLQARGGWQSRTLDLTLEGATVGTLAYMSPEQARGESLDARSDLFSLGVVMYEMATRQVPFKGVTSALVFVELFHRAPELVRSWNQSVSRDLERVILRLLEKNRKSRFQTARDLRDSLTKVAAKKSKGGWLKKGAVAVPLVPALDPVARLNRPRRQPGKTLSGVAAEVAIKESAVAPPVPEKVSSSGNMVIRPVRIPERERQAAAFRQASAHGALAVESGVVSAQVAAVREPPLQSDTSAAAAAAKTLKRAVQRESMLARSGSGMTQFEFGADDLEQKDSVPGDWVRQKPAHFENDVAPRSRRWGRMAVASALILAVASGILVIVRSGLLRRVVLGPKDGLLLTVIQNKTGDKTLDGTVMQAMEIALRQTESLRVLGGEAFGAGLRRIEAEGAGSAKGASSQRVAEMVGARAYVFGEITGAEAPYTLSVDVLEAASNDKIASLQERAGTREEIPAAAGRLAQAVRAELGERGTSAAVSLEQEATANVDALHAFAVGESARQSGRVADALAAYREAATLDPNFVQAQMRLAWLYRSERAEIASARAAELAGNAAIPGSGRRGLLAQFCYEVNTSGDFEKALGTMRRYVALYPLDVDGLTGLARVLRLQGYLPEALLAAQQGYGENPFDADAYAEAELAMIGMDRYSDVLQLQSQARRLGIAPNGDGVIAEYLSQNSQEKTERSRLPAAMPGAPSDSEMTFSELNDRGLYLDNTGRMQEGLALRRTAAARASQSEQLASGGAYLLAQGALDRALGEDCGVALDLVKQVRNLPSGLVASFNAGMAAALCGDQTYGEKVAAELQQNFPQSSDVKHSYVTELKAAGQIGGNEPAKALQLLAETGVHDQMTLKPYLRGLAQLAMRQPQAAHVNFQAVRAHRGLAFTTGSNTYPMAEIGLARAFAAAGDKADSVAEYRRFLVSWSEADRGDPQFVAALARSR